MVLVRLVGGPHRLVEFGQIGAVAQDDMIETVRQGPAAGRKPGGLLAGAIGGDIGHMSARTADGSASDSPRFEHREGHYLVELRGLAMFE